VFGQFGAPVTSMVPKTTTLPPVTSDHGSASPPLPPLAVAAPPFLSGFPGLPAPPVDRATLLVTFPPIRDASPRHHEADALQCDHVDRRIAVHGDDGSDHSGSECPDRVRDSDVRRSDLQL